MVTRTELSEGGRFRADRGSRQCNSGHSNPALVPRCVSGSTGSGVIVAGPGCSNCRRWRRRLAAGFIGMLGDWGIQKERIHQYEAGIKEAVF